jgi:hypothetical protein
MCLAEGQNEEAYLVIGPNHAGNVADGEGLPGLQAKGH